MRMTRAVYCVVCSIGLLATACGSGSGDATESATTVDDAESSTADSSTVETPAETSTSAAPTTTAESSTSTTEAPETTEAASETTTAESTAATSETGIPGTPVATFLNQTYLFGSQQGQPDAEQLPFAVNTVTAHWYQSDGFYAVVYGALAPEQALCPGNSIQTSTGFEFVSNASLGGADCSFAPTVAEAPNGVVTCNRVVSYITLIPAGTEGILFGTIETMTDGLGVGLTSQVQADPANMPTIDRSLIDC